MERSEASEKKKLTNRYFVIVTGVILAALVGLYLYWDLTLSHQVSTDDAYVAGNMNTITPQIDGSVTAVNYTNTNYVRQGDIVVTLDKTDAAIAFSQAKSSLANAVRDMRKLYALDSQYQADIAAAQIQSRQASEDYKRNLALAGKGAIAREGLEHARDSAIRSQSSLNAAIQAYNANRVLIMNTPLDRQPEVLQAAEQVKRAWLTLQRTDIRSPVTGYVAQRNVQVGETVTAARALMTVIPAGQMWVNANFKETQLTHVHVGQRATLTSDLYGESVVFHGEVKGINMGTGNAFSLLPAQNASGNWIKIVQRVPVEIVLDKDELRQHPLRIGLSMTTTINTDEKERAASPASAVPAYASDALVLDMSPINQQIAAIIKRNSQR